MRINVLARCGEGWKEREFYVQASVAHKNLVGVMESCFPCVKLLSQLAYDLQ